MIMCQPTTEWMNSMVVSMNVTIAVLVPKFKHGADIPKAADFVQVDKKCCVSHPYFTSIFFPPETTLWISV